MMFDVFCFEFGWVKVQLFGWCGGVEVQEIICRMLGVEWVVGKGLVMDGCGYFVKFVIV